MYCKNPDLEFIQVKRIIGQRDARLKKNQDKAVIESKRKSKDELVREMFVSSHSLQPSISNRLTDLKFPRLFSSNTILVCIFL